MSESAAGLTLIVRRVIAAPPQFLFEAWTEPRHLLAWWGPQGVRCCAAEIDLRVGGAYRIGNRLPDGTVLWIEGQFEAIEPPKRLVYSWRVTPGSGAVERVTVRFEPRGEDTEVVIAHERIADQTIRARHEAGWNGCLDGLIAHAAGRRSAR